MIRAGLFLLMACVGGASLADAQAVGTLEGRVRESWGRGVGIADARVVVQGTPITVLTDYKGRFRLTSLPAGVYTIQVTAAGYHTAEQHRVPVYVATETAQEFLLPSDSMSEIPIVPPPIVDPRAQAKHHRLTSDDLSPLPITSATEAVEVWTPANSFRGGRPGSAVLVLDGVPVVNAYDASTTPLGLRVPLDLLSDVSVAYDSWNADLPSTLAGAAGLTMREGSGTWNGDVRFATDRPLQGSADLGYDRIAGWAEGAWRNAKFIAGIEANGRLQADAFGAPVSVAGTPLPWAVAHNSAETLDGAAKVALPLGLNRTLRLIGVYSRQRRLQFDPAYEFSTAPGDAQGIDAAFVSAELQKIRAQGILTARLSYFSRALTEGALAESVQPFFGALGGRYRIVGAEIARTRDTAAARSAVAGYQVPTLSVNTPWGVPAFFVDGSRGVLRWNRYRELRLGLSFARTLSADNTIAMELEGSAAQASNFDRISAFLPVGGSIPPATSADLRALALALKTRYDVRWDGGAHFTSGVQVEGHSINVGAQTTQIEPSPYLSLSIPIGGASIFATIARAAHFPDLQFARDKTTDDSLAGALFRRGASQLDYENVFSQEFGIAARVWRDGIVRLTLYHRQFGNLVNSIAVSSPDSGQFVNGDETSIAGAEVTVDRSWGKSRIAATGNVANVDFGSVNGFYHSSRTTAGLGSLALTARTQLPMQLSGGLIARFQSAVPFSRIPIEQQHATFTVDVLLRRSWLVGTSTLEAYVDVRNILDRRSGADVPPGTDVEALAQAAYAQNPGSIPYDSPRYRASGDLDNNGRVEGAAELLPLYRAAARDFVQPIQSYGPPRMVRFGARIEF